MRSRRGRGEGSVYQRGDGIWCASISLGVDKSNGKRLRKVVSGSSKKAVLDKLRELDPTLGGTVSPKVCDWLEVWLNSISSTVEPRTLDGYRSHCTHHLKPRLRSPIDELSAADVEKLYADLLADNVSPSMVRKIGTTLSIALNHAARIGLIRFNPARGVRKPKANKPRIEVLTAGQAKQLLEACHRHRLGPLFALMIDTGFGPGEAFALHWPDFDGESVTCSKSLEARGDVRRLKSTKNRHRVRSVGLRPETVLRLQSHREAMAKEGRDTKTGLMFADHEGGPLRISNVTRRDWKAVLKDAGLPLSTTLYALRHTMATLLLTAGVHPKIVSERLGHASVTLTLDTYSHVLPTMQKAATEALGRLLD